MAITDWIQAICAVCTLGLTIYLTITNKDLQERILKRKLEIDEKTRRKAIMPWIEFDPNFKHQQLQRENLTSFIFLNKMGKAKSAKSIKIPVCESNGLNLKYHFKEEWKDEQQLIIVDLENFHSQSSLLLEFIFEDIDGNRYQQIFKKPENLMSSPQLAVLKLCEE
jgi:hypothetical protein